MANIRDVAKEAGVSVASVSRYLNRKGYISEDTKLKIKRAIDKLEYIQHTKEINERLRRSMSK